MFTVRNYPSEEQYDLGKLMDFKGDVYDVIDSPLLNKLQQLPVARYYNVNDGYKDIDLISMDAYGDPFYAFLIQYYNNMFIETFPEDTVLNLFGLSDLNDLYNNIANGII